MSDLESAMEVPEDPCSVLKEVIRRLPPVPETTKKFLSYPAAAAAESSCVGDAGSVVSGRGTSASGCISSSSSVRATPSGDGCPHSSCSEGSGRVLTCDVSSVPAASTSCTDEEAVGSFVSGGGVSASDVVSCSVRVPGDLCTASSAISGPAILNAEVSSDARASSSSGCALSNEVKSSNCSFFILPDRAVALIVRLLPTKDVFRLGFLLSRRWLEIWQGIPLTIHDMQLVPDSIRVKINEVEGINVNVVRKVSTLLELHPGPIDTFRVDFSTWRGNSNLQWRIWIEKMISKMVQRLILRGRWPRHEMEILPNNLMHCSSLVSLHLCCFNIPRLVDKVEFPHLLKFELSNCLFKASDLDNMLIGCSKLKMLKLGYIGLDVLNIQSRSLRSLFLWSCSIDYICLNGTPALSTFSQEPERYLHHKSHIQFREIPKLRVLHSLYLSQQAFEICGYSIKAHLIDHPLCCTVTLLGLVVNFSSQAELMMIPSLLKCFPNLRSLKIYRLDSWNTYTGPVIDWRGMLSNIQCIKTALGSFNLYNGSGEDVEIDLANSISGCASSLTELHIELHPQFQTHRLLLSEVVEGYQVSQLEGL